MEMDHNEIELLEESLSSEARMNRGNFHIISLSIISQIVAMSFMFNFKRIKLSILFVQNSVFCL